MSEHVLHDKDIREPLFDFLEETYGKVRKASFSYSRHCWNGWITTRDRDDMTKGLRFLRSTRYRRLFQPLYQRQETE